MTDFNNVVETYLAMQKSNGVGSQAALMAACEATGRKFNLKYLTTWVKQTTPIPDEIARYMQLNSTYFALQMFDVKVTKQKANKIALALSTPMKKPEL